MRFLLPLLAMTVVAGAVSAQAPGAPLVREVAASALPRTMPYRGSVVAARRWTDRLGENFLVLTQTGRIPSRGCTADEGPCRDAELYAYHYVQKGGTTSLLWRTVDFVRDCPLDLYVAFLPGSTAVTDLDGDGIAETSFMYMLACRSDVSPAGLKLIMHEGATKYAARGTTRPRGAEMGGEVRLDPALQQAPRLRSFVVRQWERFRGADRFQQF